MQPKNPHIGTFLTSIAGALFYALIAPFYTDTGLMVAPDWMLGSLFGIGGFLGMYCGAQLKNFFPQDLSSLFLFSPFSSSVRATSWPWLFSSITPLR